MKGASYPQRTHLPASRFGNAVPSDVLRTVASPPQFLAQAPQVCVHIFRVVFDRDMIYSGRTPIGLNLRKGRPQRRLGMDLVDQAVPFTAFDPLFEGLQHPCRPNRRFGPRPVAGKSRRPWVLSGAVSRLRHSRRCLSVAFARHVSTFLHPFAPPALPGFIAIMGTLTPARRRDAEARSAPRGGRYLESFLPLRRAPLLASRVPSLRSITSPTTQLPPMIALTPTSSASWASCSRRSGLSLSLAGSPVSMAESSLLSLRTTPFAFRCSPPRLATTQLRSATGRGRLTSRGLAPPWTERARERTRGDPVVALLADAVRRPGDHKGRFDTQECGQWPVRLPLRSSPLWRRKASAIADETTLIRADRRRS